jgi:tRNA(Ile)-lysidine synthase TilS/MesJ
MPSKIITLDPQHYGDAHATRKIESVARRLRYRALGTECRECGIMNLLFAHHADDQAETTLMRLANNYLGSGLAGMRREARIPECEDLYGVHDSGSPRILRREYALSMAKAQNFDMLVESGGITILRPLLSYTKDRLVATCEDASTQWVEDHTNKDRSLTLRNTVRYLHEADLLPVALRRPNLCAIAARISDRVASLEVRADQIFRSFDITFDPRSGHAVCKAPHQTVKQIEAMTDSDRIRAMLLRKVLMTVVPTETLDLSTLEAASSDFLQLDERWRNDKRLAPIVVAGAIVARLHGADGPFVYEARRAPPPRNVKESRQDLEMSLPLQQHEKGPKNLLWSDWKLWDERYWIRIGSPPREDVQTLDVVVRLMTPEDISSLRQVSGQKSFLLKTLKSIPGHLRTTLPVIVQLLPGSQNRIVALPSLGWSRDMWSSKVGKQDHQHAQYYDIRYKHIDDSLTSPMANESIV